MIFIRRKIKEHSFLIVVVGIFFVMVLLNMLTPLVADDLEYFYKTESFSTIFRDEYQQYMGWTGRSVVHVLARLFLLAPKILFNFLNPLAYTYLSLLIYFISTDRSTGHKLLKYILINICIWLFIPAFGQVFLWETGSANYLWGSIIILSFLAIYHGYYQKQFIKKPAIPFFILMFVLGLLAGWCNENTSGGAIIIAIGYLFLLKNKKNIVPKWMYSGIVGAILGLVIMVSSPGNKVRAAFFERSRWSISKKIFTGVLDITKALYEYSLSFFLLFAVVFVLFTLAYLKKEKLLLIMLYTFSGMATLYVLSFSPAGLYWGRSFYGGIIFLIIAFFIAWPDYIKVLNKQFYPFYGGIVAMLIVSFLFSFIIGVSDIVQSGRSINARYNYLQEQRKLGNMHPVLGTIDTQNITSYPAYSNSLSHIGIDKKAQINQATAAYFGVDDVTAVSQKDWEAIYKNGNPKLMNIQNLKEYIDLLKQGSYTILFSGFSQDTIPTDQVMNDLKQLFPEIEKPQNKNWTISGIVSSKIVDWQENSYYSETINELNNEEIQVKTSCTPYESQTFSKITVNGVELSRNKEGFNFVILDTKNSKILDSVSFSVDLKNTVTR